MTDTSKSMQEVKARMDMAQQAFTEYPDKFPPAIREKILAREVVLGMDTYQAYLAAGLFSYVVQADTDKWPPHSDPMRVIWAQPARPDNSEITLNFFNDAQFAGEGLVAFRVRFKMGRAVEIEKHAKLSTQEIQK